MIDYATGTLGGLLVVNVAQFVSSLLKRRWYVQDRKAADAKLVTDAEDRKALADKVAAANQVAVATRAEIVDLINQAHNEIKANTKVSTEAFHEANGAKQLIADVNRSLTDEVRRRNDLAVTAEATAGLRNLTDPLGTARLLTDLRARVELLERRAHPTMRQTRPSTKGGRQK